MKILCEREAFLAAFQTAASVVPARTPKPILQNVKIECASGGCVLMATDLEVGLRIEVPGVEVETPGTAILPVTRFGPLLRESSDEKLKIVGDPQAIVVRGERSEHRFPSEDPAEFPAVTAFNDARYQELPARLFRTLVHRTLFATDTESSRYALGGVLLEMAADKITAVATDGRRLAKMEGPAMAVGGAPQEGMTIIPSRSMQLMERAVTDADAEVKLAVRGNDVVVRTPRATIYSRLVEGRFPKWRDVLPDRRGTERIELTVGPLFSALRQAAIVASDDSRGIDFTFKKGILTLDAETADRGKSHLEVPIAYEGKELTVTLDHRFVADFLKVLDPEKTFSLDIRDSDTAVLCTVEDGYSYVIMPLSRDRRR
jgi:DNA polymerase-3 subunit beta